MNEFIEMLIGRLEKRKKIILSHKIVDAEDEAMLLTYNDSINIVNQLAEEYKPKTNADEIRAMNDEELAKWLTSIINDAQLDARTKCNYQWDEWLKEEVKQS